MASKVTVELLDDVDGKPADETIPFGLDGVAYEIDLSDTNAKALRAALEPFVTYGRRTGGRLTRGKATAVVVGVDNKAVRAWADSNGIAVSARGRISAEVIEQYHAAGN